MRAWLRWGALLGGLVAGATGCAWITSLPDDYVLADGGTSDDANGEADDGSNPNDGADAPSFDAAASPCASDAYVFCADFDKNPWDLGWTKHDIYNGGVVGPDDTDWVSFPTSMLAFVQGSYAS